MNSKKDNRKVVIDKLKSYATMQKSIEYKEKKIKIIDHELTRVRVTRFEEIKGGGDEYRVEKLLDEKHQLVNQINNLKLEKNLLMEAVNSLDEKQREIIVDFYFKKNNITKIAQKILYSETHVRRIRSHAINILEKIIC